MTSLQRWYLRIRTNAALSYSCFCRVWEQRFAKGDGRKWGWSRQSPCST